MEKNFIIVILGKSASGKTTVEKILEKERNLKRIISTTTRPIRSGEQHGVDYHFISKEEFENLIHNNDLIEYRYHDTIENGKNVRWYYGIKKGEIDLKQHSYIAVVDLEGLKNLRRIYGKNVVSIYLDVSESSRRIRALARDKNFERAEWERRIKSDDIDFANVYTIVDLIVKNEDFSECVSDIKDRIDYIQSLKEYYKVSCNRSEKYNRKNA